jgi:uncharacterized protein
MNQYVSQGAAVIDLPTDSRNAFINKTYAHLTGAIFAFAGIEIAIFKTGMAEKIALSMGGNWLLILGAFMVVSWFASSLAHSQSRPVQYAALAAYVGVWAVMFVPMLFMAERVAPGAIKSASLITFVGFSGLTATVFITKQDFSFLGGILKWAGIMAIVAIVGGLIFKWQLGMWFSVAMVGFAGASILYTTSNILHTYREDQYVGAALELFAGVALLLWYVLRIFMMRGED